MSKIKQSTKTNCTRRAAV